MSKLYKMEMYILDVNEQYSDLDEIICSAENSTDINLNCFNSKVSEFEWHDELTINKCNCTVEDYRKYFN